MGLRDVLKKARMIEDVGAAEQTTGGQQEPTSETGNITGSSPRSTAAAILLNRGRQTPPATTPTTIETRPTRPNVGGAVSATVDPEFLNHFRSVADSSKITGYTEFLKQMDVLRKHIHDDAALVAAAVDSTMTANNVGPQEIIAAINDRIKLVADDKSGALQELGRQQKQDTSDNEGKIKSIDAETASLHAEIERCQERLNSLAADKRTLGDEQAQISVHYEDGKKALTLAADQVLDELGSQLEKLRYAAGIGINRK